jgi:uncharacterized protein YcbK (DUF882 family)
MISEHITEAEAFKSQTATRKGIDNTTTDPEVLANMKHVAELFEQIRANFGKPIGISSFYRSPALNKAVGGAKTSQHVRGEAIDIDADIFGGVKNSEIFAFAKTLDFDQLLWEFGNTNEPAWVHISRKRTGKNRKQILTIA